MTLGRKSDDDGLLLEGFHCRWSTAHFRGDITTALAASREGIKRYDPARHSWMGPVFGGHDPGVCAHGVVATVLALVGRYAEGKRPMEQAVRLADELKHPNSRAHALIVAVINAQIAGDCGALGKYSQQAIALADKYNIPPVRAHAAFISGWGLAFGNDFDAGIAAMEAEFPRASAVGPFFLYYAALLAEVREKAGRVADALAIIRWALDTVAEPGVGFCISELYRLQGICLLRTEGSSLDEAMRSLQTAIDVARQQRATLLELRAAVSYASASIATGRRAEGLGPLRDLCASLPAAFDAANLVEARQLLSG